MRTFMRIGAVLIALLGAIVAARDGGWVFSALLLMLVGWIYLRHNRYGAAGDGDDE